MSKRVFLAIIVLFAFLLSSCEHQPTLEEQYDSLLEESTHYEDNYYEASSRADDLASALSDINDEFSIAYSHYCCGDDDISERKALSSLENIRDILNRFGY